MVLCKFFYRQDLPQAALPVLFLLAGRFWGHKCSDQGEIWQGRADRRNFTNIIAPKWRLTCTIFTKFTVYMRILSLHNVAEFGCFILINDKIINNLLRWGRFQPNFWCPLAEKLWMGPKKVWDLKWWPGPLLSKFGGNPTTHVGARGWNVMFFTLFIYLFIFFCKFLFVTLRGRRPLWCVVDLLPQDIASAFVGRLRRCLQRFFAEEKHFPENRTVFKIVARWCGATIGAPMREEIVKIWENGCKVCAHHFDI